MKHDLTTPSLVDMTLCFQTPSYAIYTPSDKMHILASTSTYTYFLGTHFGPIFVFYLCKFRSQLPSLALKYPIDLSYIQGLESPFSTFYLIFYNTQNNRLDTAKSCHHFRSSLSYIPFFGTEFCMTTSDVNFFCWCITSQAFKIKGVLCQ